MKNVVLFEGHVRWIMERETPAERLAAWETLAAIAFPHDHEFPYRPPEPPADGKKLSPCDRARRDTYNMLGDFFTSRVWEQSGRIKDQKKSAAGKIGAAARYGMGGCSDSTAFEDEVPKVQIIPQTQRDSGITMTPRDVRAEETDRFAIRYQKIEKGLTDEDRKMIAEWRAKIPNPAALKEWLSRNFLYQNRDVVLSDAFCELAFNKLSVEDKWVSYKTGHAIQNIRNTIHWMAIDYIRKSREIKRVEEEEHRKDLESEFETKSLQASQMSNEEIAALERKRRRQAEREAMDKILRGEL